jgi:probable addiction module antidote protein
MIKKKNKTAKKPGTPTRAWDAAEHIKSADDVAAYLNAAFEDGDPALIAAALGDIARAKGMTAVARSAGLGRESLYKALSPEGRPELATIMKVVQALGLKLTAAHV